MLAILMICLDLLYVCWLWSYFQKFVMLLFSSVVNLFGDVGGKSGGGHYLS